jgi:hypothetical protein
MRTRAAILSLVVIAAGTAALAQRRTTARPGSAPIGAGDAAATADASAAVAAPADAGAAGDGAAATAATPTTFDIPMRQVGTGAVTHYPIPEQLARNDVPVFVQVRSSAPIDHVSLFYRSRGATRYREVRMTSMGQNLGLPNGYGVQVPCEDAFPPAIEYYVQAIDTSGAPVGAAGTAAAPISIPVVTARHYAFVPTLPGQNPPRNCGSLVEPVVATAAGDAGTRPTRGRDAGPVEEVRGTADLGEPCTRDLDCISSRLRCGSNHRCVLVGSQ